MSKARFVIVGRLRNNAHPWIYYITENGCITSNSLKAHPVVGVTEAKAELLYWNRSYGEKYVFSAERLPPRVPLKTALLRAEAVEL